MKKLLQKVSFRWPHHSIWITGLLKYVNSMTFHLYFLSLRKNLLRIRTFSFIIFTCNHPNHFQNSQEFGYFDAVVSKVKQQLTALNYWFASIDCFIEKKNEVVTFNGWSVTSRDKIYAVTIEINFFIHTSTSLMSFFSILGIRESKVGIRYKFCISLLCDIWYLILKVFV